MYRLVFGKHFLKSAEKLDQRMKPKLKESLDFLAKDPFHPALKAKPLTGNLSGYYAFRLGKDYRVVFVFLHNRKIYLLFVGHRKDVYRK